MTKFTKFITLSSVTLLTAVTPISALADETTSVVAPDNSVAVPTEAPTPADSTTTPSSADTTTPSEVVPSQDTQAPSVTPSSEAVPSKTPSSDVVVPSDNIPSSGESTTTTAPDNNTSSSSSEEVTTTQGNNTTTQPSTTEQSSKTDATTQTEGQTDKPTDNTTTPSYSPTKGVIDINGNKATVTADVTVPTNNPNISADTAYNAGASQVGTTSTVTGQVVENVTVDAPVYTNTGYQVVSTKDSQVIVANADGSTSTVAPEAIGATLNSDQTISVQTVSGETKTLPHTGEKSGIFASISGIVLIGLAWVLRKNKKQV